MEKHEMFLTTNKVICEKCGKEMKIDDTVAYCSYPPQYRYNCVCGNTVVRAKD